MKAFRCILWTGLWVLSGTLGAIEASSVELKWSPVRGAGGYRVEIRPESGPLIRRAVTGSNLSVELEPGLYEFRIIVLNKFGRSAADTGWRPLRVRLAVKPVIAAVSRAKTSRGTGTQIRIRGKNFLPQTRVRLRGEDGIEHEFIPQILGNGELFIRPRDHLPPGKYDVIVKNPGEDPVVGSKALAYRGPSSLPGGGVRPDVPRADRAMARSVVLPGWGQFAKGDYFKSVLVAGGLLLPLAIMDATRHDFLAAKDDIRATDTNLLLFFLNSGIPTEAFIINTWLANTNQANLRQAAGRYRAASALAMGFYAYNLWDAYATEVDDEPVSRGGAIWRSAVLPGWGQSARGENVKGGLLIGATMLSLALLSDNQANFARASRERDTAILMGLLIPISSGTSAANLWTLDLFQDSNARLNRTARNYERLSWAALGLYVYNLFDAWQYYRGKKATPGRTSLKLGVSPAPDGRGTTAVMRFELKF